MPGSARTAEKPVARLQGREPGAGQVGDVRQRDRGDHEHQDAAHRRSPEPPPSKPSGGNVSITLTVYAHVMPGDQKRAATRFAALIGEAAGDAK